jgi:hypothetical protein
MKTFLLQDGTGVESSAWFVTLSRFNRTFDWNGEREVCLNEGGEEESE